MDKNIVAERMRTAKASGMSEADAVMVSMKRDKSKDKKNSMDVCSPCGPDSDYPYGLEVRLEHESLEKLGIAHLPDADDTVKITAVATISNVSSSLRDGKKNRSLTLQITKMALSDAKEPAADTDDENEE